MSAVSTVARPSTPAAFKFGEEALLRRLAFAEVLLEGVAKEVGGDEGGLRARGEHHDGRASRAGADVEDASRTGLQERLGGELGLAVDVDDEAGDDDRGEGPEGNRGGEGEGPTGPLARRRGPREQECGKKDREVAVAEPPGIAVVDRVCHAQARIHDCEAGWTALRVEARPRSEVEWQDVGGKAPGS